MLGSGNYLKTKDVENGTTITIKNEGEWVESTMYKYEDGNPKVDFVVKVEVNGEEKSMRVNKTNRDILIEAYGNDTAEWIGKTAVITKEKIMVAGEKKDTIVLDTQGASAEVPF